MVERGGGVQEPHKATALAPQASSGVVGVSGARSIDASRYNN